MCIYMYYVYKGNRPLPPLGGLGFSVACKVFLRSTNSNTCRPNDVVGILYVCMYVCTNIVICDGQLGRKGGTEYIFCGLRIEKCCPFDRICSDLLRDNMIFRSKHRPVVFCVCDVISAR